MMRLLTFLTFTLFFIPVQASAQSEATGDEETKPATEEAAPAEEAHRYTRGTVPGNGR